MLKDIAQPADRSYIYPKATHVMKLSILRKCLSFIPYFLDYKAHLNISPVTKI